MSTKIVWLIIFLSLNIFSKCDVVKIEDGKLKGTVMKTRKGVYLHAFMKIPYAEPPIGSLRFQPPVQIKKWEGILDATRFGPMCMQNYHGSDYEVSEDCLHLNVFTKSLYSIDLKPVIIYIHGGGFHEGSAIGYGPNYLLDRDVVLVTINYRLGSFGFLATGTKEATGNMGLKDQVMALKWVQRNIARFGGCPEQVTISGLSAGAFSVTAHMVSEMSKGLFHRVIAMSGAITWQTGLERDNANLAKEVAKALNCSGNFNDLVPCLQKRSAEEIVSVSHKNYFGCLALPWQPVVEPDFGQERFLTDDPNKLFKSGNFTKVPVIIGITENGYMEPVVSLLNNKRSVWLLNNNFAEIASKCFNFKENGNKTTEEIAKILRNHYLPFDKIDKRAFSSLALLNADGTTGYAVHRFTHFVSPFADVYYYKFSYVGRFSSFNYPRNKPYGAYHDDASQYIFSYAYIPVIMEPDPENFMVERMTRIWEQFAKFGNPNNPADAFLGGMSWPKHDSENEYFLDIRNHMIKKQGLFLERYHIWDNLEGS